MYESEGLLARNQTLNLDFEAAFSRGDMILLRTSPILPLDQSLVLRFCTDTDQSRNLRLPPVRRVLQPYDVCFA